MKKVFRNKDHMFVVGPDCEWYKLATNGPDCEWYKVCRNQKGGRIGFARACFLQESVGSTWIMWRRWWEVIISGWKMAEKRCEWKSQVGKVTNHCWTVLCAGNCVKSFTIYL